MSIWEVIDGKDNGPQFSGPYSDEYMSDPNMWPKGSGDSTFGFAEFLFLCGLFFQALGMVLLGASPFFIIYAIIWLLIL
jgi:hypothetical protein